MPINWETSGWDINYTALGYNIQDAYNLITKKVLEADLEWLFVIEDDVLIPPYTYVKMGEYINHKKIPIVSGLYYAKTEPPEPLIFRGRGNGTFRKFKIGEKVWCDGLPMGCLLIHASILKEMWDLSEEYKLKDGTILRNVFEMPRKVFFDLKTHGWLTSQGTQDLYFFDRVMDNSILRKCGFKQVAKRKYPFLCDTSIFCKHIDRKSGRQYP